MIGYFILIILSWAFTQQVTARHHYPNIGDNCMRPLVFYNSSDVAEFVANMSTLLMDAKAAGAIDAECMSNIVSLLSGDCLDELYIKDGCCSSTCNRALALIYYRCFWPLVSIFCSSNNPVGGEILSNVGKRCLYELNGTTVSCSLVSSIRSSAILPPPSSSPPPAYTYVYPALYNTSLYECSYGPEVYYPGVTVAYIVQTANQMAETGNLSACSVKQLELLLGECAMELTVKDGCCSNLCAAAYASVKDECVEQIFVATCIYTTSMYPYLANSYKRCISGFAPVCTNGTVNIALPSIPAPMPPSNQIPPTLILNNPPPPSTGTPPRPSPPPTRNPPPPSPPSMLTYPAFFEANGVCFYGNSTYLMNSTYAQVLLTPAYEAVIFSPSAPDCSFNTLIAALESCSEDLTVHDGCCLQNCARSFTSLGSECLKEILQVLCAENYSEGFFVTGNLYKRCIYGYAPTCTDGIVSFATPSST